MEKFHIKSKLLAMRELGESLRHKLHAIPESSGKEYKTSAFCQQCLREWGYTITSFEGYTGFWADLKRVDSAPCVAFRADMDALEMHDMTSTPYRSTHEGLAHNCGHDLHMAIALVAARYIAMEQENLSCNVRFIFQMAEEKAHIPGADKMVELGCMEGVDEVYALHNDASLEYGSVKINQGIMSSFGSIWSLEIEGKAAHGSTPHKGLDAIREGARILEDMDYIVAKRTDPFAPAVFSCGMFHSGSIPNGVSERALLQGTIRAMDKETNEILKNAFKEIESQSALRGFKTRFEYNGYPAIINHPACANRLIHAATQVLKDPAMLDTNCAPMSASEDFSYMIEACRGKKGAMYFLGSGNSALGICNYLHSNPYYVEDRAILVGAQIWIQVILDFMRG